MKIKSYIRVIVLVTGIGIAVFVGSQFAAVSTRMVLIAAGQYLRDIMFLE